MADSQPVEILPTTTVTIASGGGNPKVVVQGFGEAMAEYAGFGCLRFGIQADVTCTNSNAADKTLEDPQAQCRIIDRVYLPGDELHVPGDEPWDCDGQDLFNDARLTGNIMPIGFEDDHDEQATPDMPRFGTIANSGGTSQRTLTWWFNYFLPRNGPDPEDKLAHVRSMGEFPNSFQFSIPTDAQQAAVTGWPHADVKVTSFAYRIVADIYKSRKGVPHGMPRIIKRFRDIGSSGSPKAPVLPAGAVLLAYASFDAAQARNLLVVANRNTSRTATQGLGMQYGDLQQMFSVAMRGQVPRTMAPVHGASSATTKFLPLFWSGWELNLDEIEEFAGTYKLATMAEHDLVMHYAPSLPIDTTEANAAAGVQELNAKMLVRAVAAARKTGGATPFDVGSSHPLDRGTTGFRRRLFYAITREDVKKIGTRRDQTAILKRVES